MLSSAARKPAAAREEKQPPSTKAANNKDNNNKNTVHEPIPTSQPSHTYIPAPSRAERKVQFGIDTAEVVHFTHWEPGGEYVKQLVVKNVAMRTQKIKYKLPQTRFFSMEFPETVTLSAGMSWTISITFRPVAKESYHDAIEFTTSFGKFNLPVKATLPEHLLDFPEIVDFQACPLRETVNKQFVIENIGELDSYFEWDLPKPFDITPKRGLIKTETSMTMTLNFTPEDASVNFATAVCTFGDKDNWEKSKVKKTFKLNGIGKYSHLTIEGNNKEFDFGNVFVGKNAERSFVLQNSSMVPANFKIIPAEKDCTPYFEFSTTSGTIESGGKLSITIKYTPVASGLDTTDYFNITTISGNTVKIKCSGKGMGPNLQFSSNVINFGDNSVGTTSVRTFTLENPTNVPANFQFSTEPEGTFQIDKLCGTIQPCSSLPFMVKFCPTEPINFYRRVYCLVENQDALYLDLIGTGYQDKKRPATFHTKFLDAYKARVRNGLWQFSPEQLEEMIKNDIVKYEEGELKYRDESQQERVEVLDIPGEDSIVSSEYFFDNMGTQRPAVLVDSYIDFGSCSRYRVIDSMIIRVANNTKAKVTCAWISPGEASGEEPVFVVTPKVGDVPAKGMAEFRVQFRPTTDNAFYGQQLECYTFFKSMRSFRLVNDMTFTPPFCLLATVAGNTFAPGEDTFIPKVNFGSLRLDFPSCHVDRSVYRIIRVSNMGDTPVKFGFLDSGDDILPPVLNQLVGGNSAFSVKPRCGLLRKNESQLMVFRFSPQEAKVYDRGLKCIFNSNMSNSYQVQMRGVGYVPQITFEPQSILVFKPTCIGTLAKREFVARNMSRINVDFEWRIPEQFNRIVSVEPRKATLAANSSMKLTCTFAPDALRKFQLRLPCYFFHNLNEKNDETFGENSIYSDIVKQGEFGERRLALSVYGQGIIGNLEVNTDQIDFGSVLVHESAEREIKITNPCDCDIYYSLELARYDPKVDDYDEEISVPNDLKESQIEIIQPSKMIPARSQHTITIRTNFWDQRKHHFRLYYRLEEHVLGNEGTEFEGSMLALQRTKSHLLNKNFLCDISATGVYPNVRVTDIRSRDMSKDMLWRYFSLGGFNNMLKTLGLFGKTDHTTKMDVLEKVTSNLDFDFGGAPLNSNATEVFINLQNTGVVPVDFAFCFPNDIDIKIEHWADPGEYSDEQMHHNFILENNIFSVKPKTGTLAAGEAVQIALSYVHNFQGHHRIPVLFKLKNEHPSSVKETMLTFTGTTVSESRKYLHFHNTQHTFKPVRIGIEQAPIQTYTLYNNGVVPVEYEVDPSPLEKFHKENHGFEIFSCQKTKGFILPGDYDLVKFIFTPIEAKMYEVDIPIKMNDGRVQIVTFKGEGINEPAILSTEELVDPLEYEDHVPGEQIIRLPNQIADLSLERLVFGHLPLSSATRRLVVVRNNISDAPLTFQWHVDRHHRDIVKISPQRATIAPGESRVCKFIFKAKGDPQLYNFDIMCEVINDNEMTEYEERVEAYKLMHRESRTMESMANAEQMTGTTRTSLHKKSNVDLRSSKYNPLPPINKQTSSLIKGVINNEEGLRRADRPHSSLSSFSDASTVMDFKVTPPNVLRLFITALAQTYPIEEYRSRFRNPETSYIEQHQDHSQGDDAQLEALTVSDRGMIEGICADLLDAVYQDPEVQNLISHVKSDGLKHWKDVQRIAKKANGEVFWDAPRNFDEGQLVEQTLGSELLSLPEFQNTLETVLEGTIFNLLQEANVGEFELTAKPKLVALTGLAETLAPASKKPLPQ